MPIRTGKTRTITGFLADLLEYPRWVIERDVDFTACKHGGRYIEASDECKGCRFGTGCRWLDRQRTPSMEDASIDELTSALEGAVKYLRSTHDHKSNCVCKTCHWLREARHFRRSHLKST